MAIQAEFYAANLSVSDGNVSMTAHFKLTDADLPDLDLGTKSVTEDDPQVIASVMGFVSQMLPSYSAKVHPSGKVPVVVPSMAAPVVE